MTELFHIELSQGPIALRQIQRAAEIVQRGGLIVFPTETVYGLGAAAANRRARERIFELKGRNFSKSLPIMPSSLEEGLELVQGVTPSVLSLMKTYWPGPLTLVLKTSPLGEELTGGQKTMALRRPRHAIALALLDAVGAAMAVTSANLSGTPAMVTGEAVASFFDGKVDAVLDGGVCSLGQESTILDVTGVPAKILREGALPRETLSAVFHD